MRVQRRLGFEWMEIGRPFLDILAGTQAHSQSQILRSIILAFKFAFAFVFVFDFFVIVVAVAFAFVCCQQTSIVFPFTRSALHSLHLARACQVCIYAAYGCTFASRVTCELAIFRGLDVVDIAATGTVTSNKGIHHGRRHRRRFLEELVISLLRLVLLL